LATDGSLRRSSVRIDLFRVDLSSGELFRSGVRVPIQDQPLQLLRLRLEAEGRVVTREQLRVGRPKSGAPTGGVMYGEIKRPGHPLNGPRGGENEIAVVSWPEPTLPPKTWEGWGNLLSRGPGRMDQPPPFSLGLYLLVSRSNHAARFVAECRHAVTSRRTCS
jgi:hypothetical protein